MRARNALLHCPNSIAHGMTLVKRFLKNFLHCFFIFRQNRLTASLFNCCKGFSLTTIVKITKIANKNRQKFGSMEFFTKILAKNRLFWIFTNLPFRAIISPQQWIPSLLCTVDRPLTRSANLMTPTRVAALFCRAYLFIKRDIQRRREVLFIKQFHLKY